MNEENFDKDYERFKKLLEAIFTICELSDFSIDGGLTLRDKRTGKIWRWLWADLRK